VIVLASGSASRAAILRGAGVSFEIAPAGVDEGAEKQRLLADGAGPRGVAERLAELKAETVSAERPAALVIGADQTLELDGVLYDKAASLGDARARLTALRGRRHQLHAATVVARAGQAVWRMTESPALTMRAFSDAFLDGYLQRNRVAVLGSVGCYQLEGEGAQLFEAVEGDYFAILGLPLLPLLDFLRREGALAA